MRNHPEQEEITLVSTDVDIRTKPDASNLKNITMELVQSSKWKGEQRLIRVYDDKFLSVIEKNMKGAISYWVSLTLLDDSAYRQRTLNWKLFFSSICMFLSALGLIALISKPQEFMPQTYALVAIVLFITLSVILFLSTLNSVKNTLIFYSRHGQIPVLEVACNKPNRPHFKKFVQAFITRVQKAKSECHFSDSQILAAELSEHRRLRDEGILTEEIYDYAKLNIFRHHKNPNAVHH